MLLYMFILFKFEVFPEKCVGSVGLQCSSPLHVSIIQFCFCAFLQFELLYTGYVGNNPKIF